MPINESDMLIKQGQDIAQIKQQVIDMTGWVKDILIQTKKTNGRVTNNEKSVDLLIEKHKLCPAKEYVLGIRYSGGKK